MSSDAQSNPTGALLSPPGRSGAGRPDAEPQTVRVKAPVSRRHHADGDTTVFRATSDTLDDQYELLEKIGSGGMGVVYLARDRKLGRYVAVKRLSREMVDSIPLQERFLREARAIAALNHIHIVQLYSLGKDQLGPFIVMEYIPGPRESEEANTPPEPFSLADRVHREGPLPLDNALDLITKIGSAIDYAHGRQVIHRDLKPSNVLLDASGEPKVVDFGLARLTQKGEKPLTLPGEQMLSMGYGAPEQETDASVTDARVDVYGLGALLYFCVTGKNPRYFRPNDLPEVLRMAIVKALETDREERWENVGAFLLALALVKSPDESKPSMGKSTWRCKWCETTNPSVIRYCGSCGWDGGVMCAECGSESRFGIQYCGVCGADAKTYEEAQALVDQLERHRATKDFSFILQKEKQIAAFNARGVNGRRLVERVNEMGQEAGAALRRRLKLAESIHQQLRDENYERVREHIEEYNTVSVDGAFDDTAKGLAESIHQRDTVRVREAQRARRWDAVARDAASLLAAGAPEAPELNAALRRAKGHLLFHRVMRRLAIALLVFAGYVLSAAPAYRLLGRPEGTLFRSVYAPVAYMQQHTILAKPLTGYAKLWGVGRLFGAGESNPSGIEA